MSLSKRFKHRNKAVVAVLATTAALGGGVGVAAAAGGSPSPSSSSADQAEGAEQQEGTEQQEPALNGSIQTQESADENEQQEQQRLSSQATVTKAEAERAALAAVPGTVASSQLGDENGSLIWEVDVTQADGSSVEVKVDAGNAKVLAQEAGDDSGQQESDEQGETGEQESGEQGEAGEAGTR